MNLQEVRGLIDEIEAKIEEAKETNEEEQQCVRKAHTAAATSAASGKPASAPTKHRGIHQRFQVSIIYRNFLFFFIFFSTPTVRFDWMDSVGDCFFFFYYYDLLQDDRNVTVIQSFRVHPAKTSLPWKTEETATTRIAATRCTRLTPRPPPRRLKEVAGSRKTTWPPARQNPSVCLLPVGQAGSKPLKRKAPSLEAVAG